MNNDLPAGTVCFLNALSEHESLCGRVVEIAAGPIALPEESGAWYLITAEWAPDLFQDRDLYACRQNLKPISPPPAGLPALRTPVRPEDPRALAHARLGLFEPHRLLVLVR